ncbi:alpha/beta hydrolase family esterase [Massilia niabensis]|uniref:Alpha/beta hydrolase family esterase n=1 Tax=Massilia niabensis TaxID=544910 RepID=A0ABW0LA48_9BURK
MPSYSRLKSVLKAAFRGSRESVATGLRPVTATLDRPEGRRRYLIAVPARPGPGKRALVVVLHGAFLSAEQVLGLAFPPSPLSLWLDIAEREQLVVVAPDAGKGGWNDCFASAARVARKNDVAFIEAVIDRAIAEHEVDPQRVYLIGMSRGGHMAYRLAIEIPHRLAAFSTVLANMPPPGRARMPVVALPVLVFGATADPLMPYHGGKYLYVLGFLDRVSSIEESVKVWRELAGLPDMPDASYPIEREAGGKTSVTCSMWGQAPDGLQVGLYRIERGGHVEPSRRKRYPWFITALVGAQNADIEVAEAAWEFFRHKRAGLPANR